MTDTEMTEEQAETAFLESLHVAKEASREGGGGPPRYWDYAAVFDDDGPCVVMFERVPDTSDRGPTVWLMAHCEPSPAREAARQLATQRNHGQVPQ